MHARNHADEAEATQRCDHADGAEERHRAALPCGARRAEIGVSHHDEGQRVEWRGDSVVKFGPDLIRLIHKQLVGPRGIKKLP